MLAVGDTAPDFTLKRVDGVAVSLSELTATKPALVTFFKITCPTCQLAMPYIERLSKSAGLEVIAVSQDEGEASQKFRLAYDLTMPTLLDERKSGYAVSNAYGITHVPSMFLIEPGGQISKAVSGFSKRDLIEIGRLAGVEPFRENESVPEWKSG